MELIKIIIMIEIYLVKNKQKVPMYVMNGNLEVVVEKKDILIMLEKLMILIKKLKVKLEKVSI